VLQRASFLSLTCACCDPTHRRGRAAQWDGTARESERTNPRAVVAGAVYPATRVQPTVSRGTFGAGARRLWPPRTGCSVLGRPDEVATNGAADQNITRRASSTSGRYESPRGDHQPLREPHGIDRTVWRQSGQLGQSRSVTARAAQRALPLTMVLCAGCAARRSVVSPAQRAEMRGEISGSDG
jgi:hypothetical protein